jgi:Resolvase, N terminal domain
MADRFALSRHARERRRYVVLDFWALNMPSFVAYLRGPTHQSITLHRQRQHIFSVLKPSKWVCEEEFIETVEGSRSGRPELTKAIVECRHLDVVLSIARLDDSMRDGDFISTLHGSGVSVIVCDVGDHELSSVVVAQAPHLSPAPNPQPESRRRHAKPQFSQLQMNHQEAGTQSSDWALMRPSIRR